MIIRRVTDKLFLLDNEFLWFQSDFNYIRKAMTIEEFIEAVKK